MKRFIIHSTRTAMVALLGTLWLSAGHAGGGHGPAPAADEVAKGPHGGRWLEQDGFQLELAIVEGGVPPEYRAWPSNRGEAIPPEAVTLEVRLDRLGGTTDVIAFEAVGDFLRGDKVVTEPHSFDVTVNARYQGRAYQWQYESHEGRTRIPPEIAEEAGVTTGLVGPATLHRTLRLSGRVQAIPNRVARVAAPYPGQVTEIDVELYDAVNKGDPLATVIARDSLRPTVLRAPMAGVVLKRHAALGQQAGTEALFEIMDLRRVWVYLDAFAEDLREVAEGQPVTVRDIDGNSLAEGVVSHISPTSGMRQNVHLRVPVDNPQGALRPDQFVQGEVVVEAREVPRAVRRSGLQRFREFDVVYARFGDTYEVRMLELGVRDDTWVEVLGGIEAGTEYVTGNSFLIRADIEKRGASHDH